MDACFHYDKTACADPAFVTKCPNAAPACKSWKELDACVASSSPGTSCGDAFYQAHKAELDAVPKTRRIVPSRRSLSTESRPIAFVPSDPTKVKVSGMDHAFATRLAHPTVKSSPGTAATGGRPPLLTHMQLALQKLPKLSGLAAGDVTGLIDSCDEYGARKYFSLTQFDSDVAAHQRDPRQTYDLIFSPKWTEIVAKAQVKDSEGQVSTTAPTAALGASGNIVESGGHPLQFMPIAEHRNSFLQLASGFGRTFHDPDPYKNATVSRTLKFASLGLPDFASNPPIQAAFDDFQKKHEVFFNHERFTRRPFTAKDSPIINETFSWHRQKNTALWQLETEDKPGRFTDEELRVRYDRQQDLQALLVRRNEITDFITDVGSICRKQAEPLPPSPKDAATLTKLANNLTVYASQLIADPGIVFTRKYLDDIDPVLVQAGISKGWTISDVSTETRTTTFMGPSVPRTAWWVQYNPSSENGPFTFSGATCRSQLGCSAQAIAVDPHTIARRAQELSNQAAAAQQYNAEVLPKLKNDMHQAFLRSVNAAESRCKSFGIPQMFQSTTAPAGTVAPPPPGGDPKFDLVMPAALSAAEAQVVASALKANILPKLEAIDALISEQLNAGIELGCFDPTQNGCDWSANRLIDFVHNYRKELDVAREADVQRCMLYTTHDKTGFAFKSKLNPMMNASGADWNKSRRTVKGFEGFLLAAEKEMIKQKLDEMSASVAMQTYDEDGKTPALGQISSTDGSFGSDLFGAEYSAGGGFRFGSLSTDRNRNYSASGNANNFTYWAGNYAVASVKILGTTNEVFNAHMDVALTDGHLLDLQQGATSIDKKYLTGEVSGGRDYVGEAHGIKATFQKAYAGAVGDEKNRIVQGHLHFRVAQDDLFFEPVNTTVQPRVYASTEPLYSFEPTAYDTTLFDESTTIVVVIVPVTLRGWATFHAGVSYSIAASLDRPNVDSNPKVVTDWTPFRLINTIEPYAQVDGNLSVAAGVPGLEVGVKGSLTLIRMGLPYHSTAEVQYFGGGGSTKKSHGNRFYASQGLDFTLSTLSGSVSGYVEFLFWSAEAELFHWDGITSTTPIFGLNELDASVAMSAKAVQDLKPGFKLDP